MGEGEGGERGGRGRGGPRSMGRRVLPVWPLALCCAALSRPCGAWGAYRPAWGHLARRAAGPLAAQPWQSSGESEAAREQEGQSSGALDEQPLSRKGENGAGALGEEVYVGTAVEVDDAPRGFATDTAVSPSFRGFGTPATEPRGFGVWQEEEEEELEPQMTAEERHVWKRRVMQRWSKIIQGRGDENGEMLARLEGVTVQLGERRVLSPQSWGVRRGQRIGVLGESGCGKSLQLRLLAGEAVPTSGTVHIEDGTTVELVDQDAPNRLHASRATLAEYARARLEVETAVEPEGDHGSSASRWHDLLDILPSQLCSDEAMGTSLCAFSHGQLVRVGAAGKVLASLSAPQTSSLIPPRMSCASVSAAHTAQPCAHQDLHSLVQVATAVAIARAPSLLLLDEPTNHLDLEGIEWLERTVLAKMGEAGVVVVSHDREVLERLSTHLLHSSGGHGELYTGTYSDFLSRLAVQEEALAQLDGDGAEDESGWEAGGLVPPPLPDRYRPSRFHLLTGKTSKPKEAGQRKSAKAGRRAGKRDGKSDGGREPMLALHGVSLEFGALIQEGGEVKGESGGWRAAQSLPTGLRDVCLDVHRGEVVLLVGDNGAGKSTLLNAASGLYPLTAGEVRRSDESRPFFLSQDAAHALVGDDPAFEWIRREAPDASDEACRKTMRKMGIPTEAQTKPLSVLSGGERTRLCIAAMLLSRCNLLVLDEPTNHLDLLARQYLEEAIRGFDGAVLLVSHDRYFAAQVSTRVVELNGRQVQDTGADYRSYVGAREELHERMRKREVEGAGQAVTAPRAASKRETRRQRARSRVAR